MRSLFAFCAVFLLVVAVATIGYAVSFDCNKAKTLVEHTICSNTELSSLDDQLATLYKEAIKTTDNKESLKSDQRKWLTIRNNCIHIECLKEVYANRISDLDRYATQSEGERPPGSGEIPVDQRFLGEFTGTAVNTTDGRNGSMAVKIEPSDSEGQVRILTRAWDGLGGKGELLGAISADGKLRASGEFKYTTTLGGTSTWHYDITGMISDNRLTGNYILKPPFKSRGRSGYIWQQFETKDKKRPQLKTQKGRFDLEKSERAYTPR